MKVSKEDQEYAFKRLRELLKPGDIVYTIVKHVSRSGMMRHISAYVIKDNKPQWISYWVSQVLEWPLAKDDGLKVGGCGMDMGFHLVYSLSSRLFPNGFDCIGDNCPSNDHVNRDEAKHHSDGGYALVHKWF